MPSIVHSKPIVNHLQQGTQPFSSHPIVISSDTLKKNSKNIKSPDWGIFSTQKYLGEIMPYINVQIIKGASREQKSKIVKDMTDSLVNTLGKKPEHIHIVIQEIEEENWGFEGLLTDDWKKKKIS
jgi:4-oxalocrotonate tautomerase